jgi:hypothetical protein
MLSFTTSPLPLAPCSPSPFPYKLYTWKLNHGQTIWDIRWCAIGNVKWTHWELGEHFVNLMGTQKHTHKQKSPPPPFSPSAFSLVTWNFYFQNGWTPFATWARLLIGRDHLETPGAQHFGKLISQVPKIYNFPKLLCTGHCILHASSWLPQYMNGFGIN